MILEKLVQLFGTFCLVQEPKCWLNKSMSVKFHGVSFYLNKHLKQIEFICRSKA